MTTILIAAAVLAIITALAFYVKRTELSRFRNNLHPGDPITVKRNGTRHTATIKAIYTGGTFWAHFDNGAFEYISIEEIYPLN